MVSGNIKCRNYNSKVADDIDITSNDTVSNLERLGKEMKASGKKRGASMKLKRALEEEAKDISVKKIRQEETSGKLSKTEKLKELKLKEMMAFTGISETSQESPVKSPSRSEKSFQETERTPTKKTEQKNTTYKRTPQKTTTQKSNTSRTPIKTTTKKSKTNRTPIKTTGQKNNTNTTPLKKTTQKNNTDRTPMKTTAQKNNTDRTPIKTTAQKSNADKTPIKTTAQKSNADKTPIKTTAQKSNADRTPIKTTTQKSNTKRTPIKTTAQKSNTNRTPIKTKTQKSNTDRTPTKTTTQKSNTDRTPTKTTAQKSSTDRTPVKTTAQKSITSRTPTKTPVDNDVQYQTLDISTIVGSSLGILHDTDGEHFYEHGEPTTSTPEHTIQHFSTSGEYGYNFDTDQGFSYSYNQTGIQQAAFQPLIDHYNQLTTETKREVLSFCHLLTNALHQSTFGGSYNGLQSPIDDYNMHKDMRSDQMSSKQPEKKDHEERLVPLIKTKNNFYEDVQVNPSSLRTAEMKAMTAKSPSIYLLNKVVDLVFTERELLETKGAKGLDPHKMDAVREYMFSKCSTLSIEQIQPRTFRVTIQNKIGNARMKSGKDVTKLKTK